MEENKISAETLKKIYDSLTDEQKEKAKAFKTTDELLTFAGKEGIELPEEVLNAVAGGIMAEQPMTGYIWATTTCTNCGQPFSYKYLWDWGLEGHKTGGMYKPLLCPICDPNQDVEPAGR